MSKLFEQLQQIAKQKGEPLEISVYPSGNIFVFVGAPDLIATKDEAELIVELSKRLVNKTPELLSV